MKLPATLLLLLTWLSVQAQAPVTVLTGQVFDAATGQPLPFATVYLNNSTRGTTADQNGSYRLTNVPWGNQELVGSALGYKAFRQPLRLTDAQPRTVNLRLETADNALAAVTVSARRNPAWVRQFRTVSRELMGNRPQARQCQITNPNVMSFSEEKGHLRAQAAEPLVIDNKAMGYRIVYNLLYFDLYQGQMKWAGTSHFEEMKPTDARQQAQWQLNRLKAYRGSLHHLLASLLAGTHEQEGYRVYRTPLALTTSEVGLPLVRTPERQRVGPEQAGALFKPGELAFERRLVSSQPLEVYYNRVYTRNSPYGDSPDAYSMLLLPNQTFELTTSGRITQGNGLDVRGYLGNDRLATLLPTDWLPTDNQTVAPVAVTAGRPLRPDAWLDSLSAGRNRQRPPVSPLLFVHTDKWLYVTGDHLWFSAYALDPARQLPLAGRAGTGLQVDLIAPGGRAVQHQWLQIADGRAAGSFRLADTLASGTYQLRAYTATDTMANGPSFVCSFPVHNLQRPAEQAPENRPVAGRAAAQTALMAPPDVQFLAEGGRWLAGVPGRLGIKAVQANGHGPAVQGRIVDQSGTEVARFTTNALGMGHVVLTPQLGQHYAARIDQPAGGVAPLITLPPVEAEGWSLSADARSDSTHLLVTARASGHYEQQPVYITLHCRDQLVYHQKWQLPKGEAQFSLPTTTLLPGVGRLTLWDATGQARAERLVFIPERPLPVQMRVNLGKPRYAPRETAALHFQLRDTDNYPVAATWSASVTDADQLPVDTTSTDLRTYLLLTAGLRGQVEAPALYLEADRLGAIDDLLLTQGWRRLPAPQAADSTGGWSLSGRVRNRRGRPMTHTPVVLSLEKDGQQMLRSVFTDAQGRFQLAGLLVEDTVRVRARAMTPGESDAVVTLDAPGAAVDAPPRSAPDWQPPASFVTLARERQTAFPAFYRDSTARLLAEVIVRAAKPAPERPLDVQRASLHNEADGVLVVTREVAATCVDLGDLLAKVPGLNQLFMRNYSSFGNNDPLYMIDGVVANKTALDGLSPTDVSRIELLKSATTAGMYGSRGANGVIAIYTRKTLADEPTTPVLTGLATTVRGFVTPREFYVPRYEPPGLSPHVDKRDVLYWQALGQTGSDGLATLSFPLSDTVRQVRLVLQGLTNEGVPIAFTWVLPVR